MIAEAQALESLARALEEADGGIVVVTGAGVSLASGIPTFRGTDPGAVWAKDVTELGTRAYFDRDPVGSWRWYLERFDGVLRAAPNPAHEALVGLEGWFDREGREFLLVTQNIDTLHRRAGSRRLVEIHGRADRLRCSRRGCRLGAPSGTIGREEVSFEAFRREQRAAHLPRCPECGALLRPHVLWFDEYYQEHDDYGFDEAISTAEQAGMVLFVGTSFSVGITDLVLGCALRFGARVWSIDPRGARVAPVIVPLPVAAEELLPRLVERLSRAGAL